MTAADGRSAPNAAVVVFGADPARWYPESRFVQYAAATNGAFTVQGLPPGDYLAAAVARTRDLDDGAWQDRTILAELARRAVRITLAEEQHVNQKLEIGVR